MRHTPDDLDRFVQAQETDYDTALSEIKAGRKQSHWIWYIFPQLAGLGISATSVHYSIHGTSEARAYLAHPVLGPRLVECANAVLQRQDLTVHDIFGHVDAMKFRSSMTLFGSVSPPGSIFHQIIDTFFHGVPDKATLDLLKRSRGAFG